MRDQKLPDEFALAVLTVLAFVEQGNTARGLVTGEWSLVLGANYPQLAAACDSLRAELAAYLKAEKPAPPWLSRATRQHLMMTRSVANQPTRKDQRT